MYDFFEYHSKLKEFQLFTIAHFITIGIIFVLSILLWTKKNKLKKKRNQNLFRFSLIFLLLVSDVWQQLWLVSENAWSVKRALPLQLSDLAVFLAIVMLILKSQMLFQFMYFAGLGSSIQAILTPDLGKFSFPHFQYIEFFVSHGGVVIACLFMNAALNYRPRFRSLWITVLLVDFYAVFVFFLNKLLDANYLYIMKKPEGASILNYFGPWPWYLLSLELAMVLSFYILYIPFWITKKGQCAVH